VKTRSDLECECWSGENPFIEARMKLLENYRVFGRKGWVMQSLKNSRNVKLNVTPAFKYMPRNGSKTLRILECIARLHQFTVVVIP
jgi:hypothetical protein